MVEPEELSRYRSCEYLHGETFAKIDPSQKVHGPFPTGLEGREEEAVSSALSDGDVQPRDDRGS